MHQLDSFFWYNGIIIPYICRVKVKDPEKIPLIYKATLKLVTETGLTGLSMAAIGKEAGIGMGTLYVYFKSKEELINSLYVELKIKNTLRIYKGLNESLPFAVNLKELVEGYAVNRYKYFEEHFFIDQAVASHFLTDDSLLLEPQAFEKAIQLLKRGQEELLIKEASIDQLIAFIMGGVNELVSFKKRLGKKWTSADNEKAFELCWSALRR